MTDPFAPAPSPAPLYGEPLRTPGRNGAGTAALVLGCMSLVLGALLVLPVLAIAFGVVGLRRARRGEATNRGMALWGTITGSIGLLLGAGFIALVVWVVSSPAFDRWQACDDRAVTTEQHDQCMQQFADELAGRR